MSETPNDATDDQTPDPVTDEVEESQQAPDEATAEAADEATAEAADEATAEAADEATDEVIGEAEAMEALPIPDELRVGAIVDGVVAKLVDFGAFVDIPTARGTATGLVHVSEVAPGFVENIYAEIGEQDRVRVKVLSIGDDGKIGLSIKQARDDWAELQELDKPVRSKIDKDFDRKLRKFMHGSQSIQGEARRQKRRKLGT